jgi:hypothetical protein|tara:strand:+ start:4155 stop:4580 length:426 start_codon:yes stop_codon:yes gene_type:complete
MIDPCHRREETHVRIVLTAITQLARKRIRLHNIFNIRASETLIQAPHELLILGRQSLQSLGKQQCALSMQHVRRELRRRDDARGVQENRLALRNWLGSNEPIAFSRDEAYIEVFSGDVPGGLGMREGEGYGVGGGWGGDDA